MPQKSQLTGSKNYIPVLIFEKQITFQNLKKTYGIWQKYSYLVKNKFFLQFNRNETLFSLNIIGRGRIW